MNGRTDPDVLREVANVASSLGPALAPSGHEELLRSVMSTAQAFFEAEACSLALLNETQSELVFYVASGRGAEDVIGMRVPVGRGIAGWVVTSGQPIAIADVSRDPRFARDVAESTGYLPKSILAMPLETNRQMIGVIEVLDRRSESPRDMELLALFARQAALAIENSRVFSILGRVLFEAVARAADGPDLREALLQVARDAEPAPAELAELAAHFHTLGGLGEEERLAATRLLEGFVSYAHAVRRWT